MSEAHREEIKKLESLYAEHPEGRIFTHLAEAYRKAGELEQARAVLEDGIQKHPDYSSAHVVLGRVLMDQDRSAEAEREFHRVIELDAHNMVALRALGDLARREGRSEDALDYYHRLLEVEPADEDVRALVEQVIAGEVGAEEGLAADESAEPVEETWAPHGLVDGSPFEEAAWSLSDEDETVASRPAPAEDLAGPDAPDMDDSYELDDSYEPSSDAAAGSEAAAQAADPMAGEWIPFGSSSAEDVEGGDEGDREVDPDEADAADDLPWLTGADPSDLPEGGAYEGGADPQPADAAADEEAGEGEAADAPWGQAPWGSAPSEPADELDELDEAPAAPMSSPGVMTETIAQVYARQGLYDRAAEVYRQLVRERPGDGALRERLAEMEELAAHVASTRGGTALTGEEAADEEPGEEPPRGLETFDSGGPMDEEVPVRGFESSDVDLAADAVPIEGLETQDVDPDTHLVDAGDGSGEGVEVPPDLQVHDVPQPPEEEPWAASASEPSPWAEEPEPAEPEPAEPEPAEPESAPEDGSVWTGAEWGEAEPETPYAWAEQETEPERDDSEPVEQYFRGLLAWDGRRSGSGAGQAEAAAAGPTEEAGAGSGAPGGPADAEGRSSADEGSGGEEDDDLDMFRSWLESLKQ